MPAGRGAQGSCGARMGGGSTHGHRMSPDPLRVPQPPRRRLPPRDTRHMHGICTMCACIRARLLEVAGLEDGEELCGVCPRAAQQLSSQVVAHARDVELLLDGLAQACDNMCRVGEGVPGMPEWAHVRLGAAVGTRESVHAALLHRSGHVPCSETPMATLAFLPALPAGTLGSRNACGGRGRVHIPWGVCKW